MQRRHFLTALSTSAAAFTVPTLASAAPAAEGVRLSEEFLRAVRAGDSARVRSMLGRDASLVYARDAAGRSAYVLAHLHQQPPVAQLLAEQGFLMDAVEAVLARDWERVDALGAESPGVFSADHPIGGNAVYAAAISGLGRDVWRVLQYGSDPNANPRGRGGESAVFAAMGFPDATRALDTVASLLGNGGRPDGVHRDGATVLHAAAATGRADLVRLVLRKGGDPAETDAAGRTPLRVAGDLGFAEVERLLRNHDQVHRDHRTSRFAYRADGSEYTVEDLGGYDATLRNRMVGVSHFDLEAATQIAEQYPALVTAVSYSDEAAVEAAAHTGRSEVVRALLERGAPYSLPTAGTLDDLEWARRLLAEDPRRVHERGAHDFAVMWYPAIGGGSVAMAELLLDHGADLEQESVGTTALHFAVRGGREELTEFLLEQGSDPDSVGRKFDANGQTPLDLAAERDLPRLTQLLEAAGASRRMTTPGS